MVGDILQPTHLLFVLVVALLVLGPKRLPEVGRTLGNGIRDFRSAINGENHDSRDEIESQPWHSPAEQKHEFAHTSEPTPETHEFAHETQPAPAAVPDAHTVPAAADPTPAVPSATASADMPSGQPAATGDGAAAPSKHEFAYESSEAAENSAGPPS